jgi:hypothetical protein
MAKKTAQAGLALDLRGIGGAVLPGGNWITPIDRLPIPWRRVPDQVGIRLELCSVDLRRTGKSNR